MHVRNDHLREVLHVTQHAKERWAERKGGDRLEHWLAPAIPFGGQYGEGNLLLEFGGTVFVIGKKNNIRIVVTVLTKEQAIANMQMTGGRFNAELPPIPPPTPEEMLTREAIPLHELAAAHALSDIGRNQRNDQLREEGYDPSGREGELHRFGIQAVEHAKKLLDEMNAAAEGEAA